MSAEKVGFSAEPERNLSDDQLAEVCAHIESIPDVWDFIVENREKSWWGGEPMPVRLWGCVRQIVIDRKWHMSGGDQFQLADYLRQRAART